MKVIRVFLVSPSDVQEERNAVSNIISQELNRTFADPKLFSDEDQSHIEILRWETHVIPDVGIDTQNVINNQILEYDILLGIMWKRFGTPTGRAPSGTYEEFERAYKMYSANGYPKIMFYFRTEGTYPNDSDELEQFVKVVNFKQRLETLGVFYQKYETPISFERYVREHLFRYILFQVLGKEVEVKESRQIPRIFISYAREDIVKAKVIYNTLKKAGFDAWLDIENLLPGQNWQSSIRDAIKHSKYFIALLSKASVGKRGYVQKEIKSALDVLQTFPESKNYVIPVRLEECEPYYERLKELHWLDLFPDWDKGMKSLIRVLKINF